MEQETMKSSLPTSGTSCVRDYSAKRVFTGGQKG